VAVLVGLGLAAPGSASAALSLQQVDTFDQPMFVTSERGDASRLFVVERPGRIKLKQGGNAATEFLDIADRVDEAGERGLLSMAFSPDYATSGLLYVVYTGVDDPSTIGENEAGDLHLDKFDANAGGPIEDTRREVLTIEHSSQSNHNGGQLQFGPDGHLYWSTGDGGGGGDPDGNGQDTGSLLGKILRIDPAGAGPGDYSIPASNPFVGVPGADEVWSYGLRNPWRFSFDRLNGSLLIGDVGQGAWEEVDFDPVLTGAGRGDNFGWDCREGMHAYTGPPDSPSPACATAGTLTVPVFEYPNPPDDCAAITGGYVVRDPALGDLYGRYVYADLCGGVVRSLRPELPLASCDRSEGLEVGSPSSFGEDAAGHVYVASLATGGVYRLVGTAAPDACAPQAPPPAPEPGDSTPPGLELDARARQEVDRSLGVRASANEPAEVTLEGEVRAGRRGGIGLDASASLQPGVVERLKLKLGRGEVRRVRRRLRRGRRASARVEGAATDASGNSSEPTSLRIRLTR
jgi:hypothetical protein